MKELREVEWNRNYPKVIEDDKFLLIRKNWGFRLIYEVHLKKAGESITLGTCHVLDREFKKEKLKISVKELNAKSPEFKKRLDEIEKMIRYNIV